jgi:uncharacterized protein (TIGR02722 family)
MFCTKSFISRVAFVFLGFCVSLSLSSCGPKAFQKGDYDENVEDENNLNDLWSETDMQKSVKELVDSLIAHPMVAGATKRPIMIVTKLQNKTSEHIDTQSVMDMVKVELMKRGKVQFVDKEAREDISDEYNYQGSGMVNKDTKKGPGDQIGADFVMNGRLDSIVQEIGKDKTVYYKVTLIVTNMKTGLMEWTDNKQMRKKYKKRSVSM